MSSKRPRVSAGQGPSKKRVKIRKDPEEDKDFPEDKKPKNVRKGRNAGKLAGLMDITLDIFFEVVSHLRPIDLLQLCRVSKHFRKTFMSKTVKSLWVTARKNVEPVAVPDPPPHLSEPRFAALLFEFNCFNCGRGRCSRYDHAIGVKYCSECWHQRVIKGSKLVNSRRNKDLPRPLIFQLLLRVAEALYDSERTESYDNDRYYIPDFEDVAARYRALQREDRSLLEAYIQERREFVKAVREGATKVIRWELNYQLCKTERDHAISQDRIASIKERLYQLGYADKDFPPLYHKWSKWDAALNQPRELTERIWKNIKPKLEEDIADYKQFRLECDRRERTRTRTTELRRQYLKFVTDSDPENGPYPIFQELEEDPEVKTLLEEDGSNVAFDWKRFETHIIPIMENLKAIYKRDLVEALRNHYKESQPSGDQCLGSDSDEILYRATSLFVDPFRRSRGYNERDVYYSFPELMRFIRSTYMLGSRFTMERRPRRIEYEIVSDTAIGMLDMLGLPHDTPYATVSGKAICTCGRPGFEQPTTFSRLMAHVRLERDICTGAKWRSERNPNLGDDVHMPDDHNVLGDQPFLKLLQEGEAPPQFEVDEELRAAIAQQSSQRCCNICVQLTGTESVHYERYNTTFYEDLTPEELIWHVKYKHGREATIDDAFSLDL